MKTRISNNSLEAFKTCKKETQKETVFKCIKETGKVTQKGISYLTGLARFKVSARVNELLHDQRIKEEPEKVIDTTTSKTPVNIYSVRKQQDPLNKFDESWEDKCKRLETFIKGENPNLLDKFNLVEVMK